MSQDYLKTWKAANGFYDVLDGSITFLSDEECNWWVDEKRKHIDSIQSLTPYFFRTLFPESQPSPIFADTRICKEMVRQKITVSDILGNLGIEFRIIGDNAMFKCPFHDDKRPSASFSVTKKLWWCHVCSEGGDIFRFWMKLNNCSFPDAINAIDRMA